MIDIPFVRQAGRTYCGAACLEMVYRAYGVERDQFAIFVEHGVRRPTNPDDKFMLTHSLALDAQARDLFALGIKARNVAHLLRSCDRHGLPAIMAQRFTVRPNDLRGHFRLFTGLHADGRFCMHDPIERPRTMSADEIGRHSAPCLPEVTGNWLVAFNREALRAGRCAICATVLPSEVVCPGGHRIALDLSGLLGCMAAECAARTWDQLLCAQCNRVVLPEGVRR